MEQQIDHGSPFDLAGLVAQHEILTESGARCTTFDPPDFSQLKPQKPDGPANLLNRICTAIGSIEQSLPKDQVNTDQRYKFVSVDAVTSVARAVLADNGIFFLTTPLRRSFTPIVFRSGAEGRRLEQIFSVVVINADDPADRFTWSLEVANDGLQDKGAQVVMSIARKYALIELFQLARGLGDDAEEQNHPGFESGTSPVAGGRPAGGASSPPIAQLLKDGRRDEAREAIRKMYAPVKSAGAITTGKTRRLYAIGLENGWNPAQLEQEVKLLTGVEPEPGPDGVDILAVSWKAYDTIIEYFQHGPPSAKTSGGEERTWENVWNLIKSARSDLPAKFHTLGEESGLAFASLQSESDWTAKDIELIVRTEINMNLADLPTIAMKKPPFLQMILKAFRLFVPEDMPDTYADLYPDSQDEGEGAPGDALTASLLTGTWADQSLESGFEHLLQVMHQVDEQGSRELDEMSASAQYLELIAPESNGGRTGEQAADLIKKHLGFTDPRQVPMALHGPILLLLSKHPEVAFEPPPPGWRNWRGDQLQEWAEAHGVQAPEPTGGAKGTIITKMDWAGAITKFLQQRGASVAQIAGAEKNE